MALLNMSKHKLSESATPAGFEACSVHTDGEKANAERLEEVTPAILLGSTPIQPRKAIR